MDLILKIVPRKIHFQKLENEVEMMNWVKAKNHQVNTNCHELIESRILSNEWKYPLKILWSCIRVIKMEKVLKVVEQAHKESKNEIHRYAEKDFPKWIPSLLLRMKLTIYHLVKLINCFKLIENKNYPKKCWSG